MNILNHLTPIKIIFTVFALFAWSRAFLVFRQKRLNNKELIFWTLVWGLAIIIVYIPGKSDTLARFLGIGRGFDAMIFISVIALFYAVYRLYVKSNENEQTITILVRNLALREIKKLKRKKIKK